MRRDMTVCIVFKTFFFRNKFADAVLRTHPKIALIILTYGEQYIRRQSLGHAIRLEYCVAGSIYSLQLIQPAAESNQIKFVLPGRQNIVHIVITQAVYIVLHTYIVMKHCIFGLLKITVYH